MSAKRDSNDPSVLRERFEWAEANLGKDAAADLYLDLCALLGNEDYDEFGCLLIAARDELGGGIDLCLAEDEEIKNQ